MSIRYLRLARNRAFTLIELLVVILIIGVLLAVALPSFLSQTSKAQDSVAQQQLSTGLTEAKSEWTSGGQSGFPTEALLVSYMQSSEPQYGYAVGPGTATVTTTDVTNDTGGNTVTLCQQSASGTFFCAEADEGGLTTFAAYHAPPSLLDNLLGVGTAYASSLAEVGYSSGPTEGDARAVLSDPTDALNDWGEGKAGWSAPASPSSNTPVCPDSNQSVAAFSDSANYCVGDEVTDSGHVWKALSTVYAGGETPDAAPATQNVPLGGYDAGTVDRSALIVGDGTYSGTMSQAPADQPVTLEDTYAADWYLIAGPVGTAVTLTTSIPVSINDWYSGGNGYVYSGDTYLTHDGTHVTYTIDLPASGVGKNGEDLIEIWPDSGDNVTNPTPAAYKLTVSGEGITSGSQWELVTNPTCPDHLATDAWVSTESYCSGDEVTESGHTYKAERAVNAGVDPTATPATKTVSLGDPTSGVHVTATDIGAGAFSGNETGDSFWLDGGEEYGSADYYLIGGPPGTPVIVKTDVPVEMGLWCCATPSGPDSFIETDDFSYESQPDSGDPTVTSEVHFDIGDSGYDILDVGGVGDNVQSPDVTYNLFVTADGLTSGSPWLLTGSGGGSGGTSGTGGSGGTGGTGGSGGTGGTGGSGGTGGTGGSGGTGGGSGCPGGGAPGYEVTSLPWPNGFSVSTTDSCNAVHLTGSTPVATDQAGDVYASDGSNDILKSVGGATPTIALPNVCPSGSTGPVAMAFTADGSKGAWVCTPSSGWTSGTGGSQYRTASIYFWNGSTTTMIYQGQAAFIVSPGGATVQMALSPDGSQLAYIANDETAADDAAYYAGGSNHQPPGNLYLIPTNSVTATGAATVLDSSGTGHGISNYDVEDGASAGNHLAFIDGGSDIVYDVSNSEQQTGIASADSVYLAPVGGGSPSVLIPGGGGDSWRVVGSASGNNSFACQEVDDGGYGWSADPSEVVQTAVCNNSGSVIANTSMTPASASGSPGIVVDYADNGS